MKKIAFSLIVSGLLLSTSFALADDSNSLSATRVKQERPQAHHDSGKSQCMKAAVDQRQKAVADAQAAYLAALNSAKSQRAAAFDAAKNLTGDARKAALKKAESDFRAAKSAATQTMKAAKLAAKNTFKQTASACKPSAQSTK